MFCISQYFSRLEGHMHIVEATLILGVLFIIKGFVQIFFWTQLPFGRKAAREANYRIFGIFSIVIGVVSLVLSFLEHQKVISLAQLVAYKDLPKIIVLIVFAVVFCRYIFGLIRK
jgi:uncharacterized membrane protein